MSHPRPTSSSPARHRPLIVASALAAFACATPAATATAQQPAESAAPAAAQDARPVTLNRPQTRRVQRKLDVRVDGAFGARSRAALKRWERRASLPVDGRPDTVVLERMDIALTPAQAAEPAPDGAAERSAAAPADVQGAVDAAMAQSGTPYRSGGTEPGGFDCSGLTSWAFAQVGIELPRTSFEQYKVGTAVARDELQAGDLVFYDSAGPGASDVGIATGPTKVVSATTHGVMEHAAFDSYWGGHYVGARRVSSGG